MHGASVDTDKTVCCLWPRHLPTPMGGVNLMTSRMEDKVAYYTSSRATRCNLYPLCFRRGKLFGICMWPMHHAAVLSSRYRPLPGKDRWGRRRMLLHNCEQMFAEASTRLA